MPFLVVPYPETTKNSMKADQEAIIGETETPNFPIFASTLV